MKEKNNFNVVLVNLKSPYPVMFATENYTFENIGIGYLTTSLRKAGYNAMIVDSQSMNLSDIETYTEIISLNPSFIGFSPTYLTIEKAIGFAEKLKKSDNGIHISLGGHHASFTAKEILENELPIDSIVIGEGELTIVDLMDHLFEKNELSNVKGIAYRKVENEVLINSPRPKIVNLDNRAFPARDILKWEVEHKNCKTARIISSRGCLFNCSPCTTPAFERLQNGRLLRERSVENIIQEMEYLYEEYKVRTFLFGDDNFLTNSKKSKERAKEFATEIIKKDWGISFRILCRTDVLVNNEALLLLLKKAGLERVLVGLESGSDHCLDIYNKQTTVEQNLKATELLKKHNIAIHPGFIMFNPYVTFDDLKKNAYFLHKIGLSAIFFYFSTQLVLYPGCSLIKKLETDNLLIDGKGYKSPFAYKYQDERIGYFAEEMAILQTEMNKVDEIIVNFDILYNKFEKYIIKSEYIGKLFEEYFEIKGNIQKLYFKFFNVCTDLFIDKNSKEEYFALQFDFLKESAKITYTLEKRDNSASEVN